MEDQKGNTELLNGEMVPSRGKRGQEVKSCSRRLGGVWSVSSKKRWALEFSLKEMWNMRLFFSATRLFIHTEGEIIK